MITKIKEAMAETSLIFCGLSGEFINNELVNHLPNLPPPPVKCPPCPIGYKDITRSNNCLSVLEYGPDCLTLFAISDF